MKTKPVTARIVFDASVVFSAFRSSRGASRVLLQMVKERRINGVISEVILDEVCSHAEKIPMDSDDLKRKLVQIFGNVLPEPEEKTVSSYKQFMIDPGDAHLFATHKEARCDAIVSLDKHHVLALKGKLPGCTILAPSELLHRLGKIWTL